MKAWLVRFGSLYLFNVVVLVIIGAVLPTVRVGFAAIWASLILTLATMWIKPALSGWFRRRAAKSAHERTRVGEGLVQGGLVFVVELLIWILVVWLSPVVVAGWFWGYLLPPLLLLLAWAIYSVVDDRIEAHAGALYDKAAGSPVDAAPSAPASAAPTVAAPTVAAPKKKDAYEGLTAEQRKMLDEL